MVIDFNLGKRLKSDFRFEALTQHHFNVFSVDKMLVDTQTKYQHLELFENKEFGRVLMLDGTVQTTEHDEFFYHESIVHPAMMSHPSPKKVLILGGGDGGTLEEVLKYRSVKRATLIEIDGDVVSVAKKYLRKICGDSFEDARANVLIMDGKEFIEQTEETFDVVILDLTDPVGPARALFMVPFYRILQSKMNNGGILSLHSSSPFQFPKDFAFITRNLHKAFRFHSICSTFIPGYIMEFTFSLASNGVDFAKIPLRTISRRFTARKIPRLQLYNSAMHKHLDALPAYAEKLMKR